MKMSVSRHGGHGFESPSEGFKRGCMGAKTRIAKLDRHSLPRLSGIRQTDSAEGGRVLGGSHYHLGSEACCLAAACPLQLLRGRRQTRKSTSTQAVTYDRWEGAVSSIEAARVGVSRRREILILMRSMYDLLAQFVNRAADSWRPRPSSVRNVVTRPA